MAEVWLHNENGTKAIGLQIVLSAMDRVAGTTKEQAIEKANELRKQFIRTHRERALNVTEDELWVMDWKGRIVSRPSVSEQT